MYNSTLIQNEVQHHPPRSRCRCLCKNHQYLQHHGYVCELSISSGSSADSVIAATPDQVVNASSISTPGQPGARGQFNYALDSDSETICYDITLTGVSGTYQSPARTATHIHEAARGRNGKSNTLPLVSPQHRIGHLQYLHGESITESTANSLMIGPPRIAFPNPVGDDAIRRSSGCVSLPVRVTGCIVLTIIDHWTIHNWPQDGRQCYRHWYVAADFFEWCVSLVY